MNSMVKKRTMKNLKIMRKKTKMKLMRKKWTMVMAARRKKKKRRTSMDEAILKIDIY